MMLRSLAESRPRGGYACAFKQGGVGLLTLAAVLGPLGGARVSAAQANASVVAPPPVEPGNALQADAAVDEVVVTARQAIRESIDATGTTTVVTAADLQRNPDQNVVDALSRSPGISVTPTDGVSPSSGNHHGLDAAGRGENGFILIRGLSGSYNVNLVNGENAAQGLPYSRDVELDLLPPIGLHQVVLSKTTTADMDGDAIGGTIDFRTPTAFDYDTDLTRIYVQGGISQLASDYGVGSGSGMVQFEGARRLGPGDRLGVYATGYYGKRDFAATQQDFQAGQFEFAVSEGEQGSSPPGFRRSDNLLLTSLNAQFTDGEQTRYGGAGSIVWKGETTDLHLTGTIARSDYKQSVYQKGIQADPFSSPIVRPDGLYQNGEDNAEFHYWFETAPSLSELATVQLGGQSRLGRLTADYDAFYSYGSNSAPNHSELTFVTNPDNDLNGPFQVSYRDHYPIPLLTTAQLARLNDISLFVQQEGSAEYTSSHSNEDQKGGRVNLSYQVDAGPLKTVKVGAKYVISSRYSDSRDYSGFDILPEGTTLADASFITGSQSSVIKGTYDYKVPTGNIDALTRLVQAGARNIVLSPDELNGDTLSGTEAVSSVYGLMNFFAHGIQVQPGLRYEHTDVKDMFWNAADPGTGETSGFQSSSTTYDILLPSIHVNFRPSDTTVVRAAIWRSYTRPAFFQLAGGRQTSLNDDGTISITEGNPHLKYIDALNYELSAEFAAPATHLMASFFLKNLDHYLYDRGANFAAKVISTTGIQSISQPLNGGRAQVYGLELDGEYHFRLLPGWMSGLGVSGNATIQHSEAHLDDPTTDAVNPMEGVPTLLSNAALLYDLGRVSAALSYHYNGRMVATYRFGDYGGSDLNEYLQGVTSLDATASYQLGPRLKLTAAAANLLNGYIEYRTVGRDSEAVPQQVNAGRNLYLSVAYDF